MNKPVFSLVSKEKFIDLDLYQFGKETCTPAHSFGPAARNHYLFHYILSGSGTLMANNSHGSDDTYHLKKGQGFMIFPNQITTYIADQDDPWEYIWLEFDGLRVRESLGSSGFTPDTPIYRTHKESLRDSMVHEMNCIIQNQQATSFSLIGHLYLFLDFLTRSATPAVVPKGSKLRNFYVKAAVAFIEQNYQNNISIEDIASVCGLNRSYFGKIFHDAVGKSPQQFLLDYRMIKAAELLKLSQLSIGEISGAVGYTNQLHFSRAFKNVYGVSPREWRKNNGCHIS